MVRQYTYPMAIVAELPTLPESDVLAQAQAQFFTSFSHHVFLSSIAFPVASSNHLAPPYLTIALACLGAATSRTAPSIGGLHYQTSNSLNILASDLFMAGDGLWGVMMEVDNREARLLESVLTVSTPCKYRSIALRKLTHRQGCLFATYGMLSAREEFWDMSSSTLAGTATMARRTRMHCEESSPMTEKLFLSHTASTSRFV